MLVWGPCFESHCSKALEVEDAGLAGTGTDQGCGPCLTPWQTPEHGLPQTWSTSRQFWAGLLSPLQPLCLSVIGHCSVVEVDGPCVVEGHSLEKGAGERPPPGEEDSGSSPAASATALKFEGSETNSGVKTTRTEARQGR